MWYGLPLMNANHKFVLSLGAGLAVLLVSGCAIYTPTSFSGWRGEAEFTGSGGTVRHTDGIDIWTYGEPDRRCRLLGLIQQEYYNNNSIMSFLAGATKDSRIINVAKENGGDAIVLLSSDSHIFGYTARMQGHGYHAGNYSYASGTGTIAPNTQTSTVIAVVEYLD